MGARPDQQLALNFLTAIHKLWLRYPGTYEVRESTDDLVAALAHMCIKALAAEIRDTVTSVGQSELVEGQLVKIDGGIEPVDVRDISNKIVHGTPTRVEVRDGVVRLHFENNDPKPQPFHDWVNVWFSGSQLLAVLDRLLHKHNWEVATQGREDEMGNFLESLGVNRFLPSRTAIH